MRARKWFSQLLCLILSAFLAWPSYVPLAGLDSAFESTVIPSERAGHGKATVHQRERKALLEDSGWSELADNFEGNDGRDDFSCSLLPFAPYPIDLPSLVPSAIDSCLDRFLDRAVSSILFPPLRC